MLQFDLSVKLDRVTSGAKIAVSAFKDKRVSPTVLSLTWESPYLGKSVFILRRALHVCTGDTQAVLWNTHIQPLNNTAKQPND